MTLSFLAGSIRPEGAHSFKGVGAVPRPPSLTKEKILTNHPNGNSGSKPGGTRPAY